MLVDQFGQPLDRHPTAKIAPMLRADENIFEGILYMKLYDDAIEAKGECAHCRGPLEGVLKFPKEYLKNCGDYEERVIDIKRQIIAKVKRKHYCIARVDADKLPRQDFLKRFV